MESDVSQRRFRSALVLAWAPWIPIVFGIGRAFIGVNNQKATGLGAVAGGLIEVLVYWGLGMLIASQIVALIWLVRSFSKNDASRNVISFLSICASVVILALFVGGFVWLENYRAHQ